MITTQSNSPDKVAKHPHSPQYITSSLRCFSIQPQGEILHIQTCDVIKGGVRSLCLKIQIRLWTSFFFLDIVLHYVSFPVKLLMAPIKRQACRGEKNP